MTGSRRRFTVVVPDWGQGHLSTEAVAAYVDHELASGPHQRAIAHLESCPECRAQVRAQVQASAALRTAETPCLPSSLMSALRNIPQDTELPSSPAGLAMSPEGELVEVLRPEAMMRPVVPQPRFTERSLPERASGTERGLSERAPNTALKSLPRRATRIGATAAASGLALGALAFGVTAAAPDHAPAPTADRGVFNGSVIGGTPVDAGLRVGSASEQDRLIDRWLRVFRLGH